MSPLGAKRTMASQFTPIACRRLTQSGHRQVAVRAVSLQRTFLCAQLSSLILGGVDMHLAPYAHLASAARYRSSLQVAFVHLLLGI
jgi:hypothetical protein